MLWDENWAVHLKKKPDGSFVDPHAAKHAIEWEQRNFYVILFHGPKSHPQQLYPQTLSISPSDYAPSAEEHPRNGRPGGAWNNKLDWDLVGWSEDGLLVGDCNTEPIWEQQIFESYLVPYPLADNDEPVFLD